MQARRRCANHCLNSTATSPCLPALLTGMTAIMTPDDKDREILNILREDARISAKALAAKVGLARSSLRDRIAKLEKAGIVSGYHARIAMRVVPAWFCSPLTETS